MAILSEDEGRRQSRAVRAAQAGLGSVADVRTFLNTHHEGLGGRPIDLAIASEAGLIAVEAAVTAAPGARAIGRREGNPAAARQTIPKEGSQA